MIEATINDSQKKSSEGIFDSMVSLKVLSVTDVAFSSFGKVAMAVGSTGLLIYLLNFSSSILGLGLFGSSVSLLVIGGGVLTVLTLLKGENLIHKVLTF